MSNSRELSLEQKFNIRSFETQVKSMSHEQAQDFLIKLYEQMLVKGQYVSKLYPSSVGYRFSTPGIGKKLIRLLIQPPSLASFTVKKLGMSGLK